MQTFIARENFERYSKLLEHESDLVKRQLLEDLLADEKTKLCGGDGARIVPSSTPNDRLRARYRGEETKPEQADQQAQQSQANSAAQPIEIILVLPVSGGWSVHCSVTDNALMFSSGAQAEQAARKLGACLAGLGHDVRVTVHDRHQTLIGTAHYYADPAHIDVRHLGPALA